MHEVTHTSSVHGLCLTDGVFCVTSNLNNISQLIYCSTRQNAFTKKQDKAKYSKSIWYLGRLRSPTCMGIYLYYSDLCIVSVQLIMKWSIAVLCMDCVVSDKCVYSAFVWHLIFFHLPFPTFRCIFLSPLPHHGAALQTRGPQGYITLELRGPPAGGVPWASRGDWRRTQEEGGLLHCPVHWLATGSSRHRQQAALLGVSPWCSGDRTWHRGTGGDQSGAERGCSPAWPPACWPRWQGEWYMYACLRLYRVASANYIWRKTSPYPYS